MTRPALMVNLAVVCALLAGCGSSKEPTIPAANPATVTGAGRSVTIPASIERGDYPDACSLLPEASVSDLLGAPATAGRNVRGCAWTTGRASFPALQVSWIQLGSAAGDRYDQVPGGVSTLRSVHGIGQSARIYRIVSDRVENKTIRLDVLDTHAYFRVDVSIVTTSNNKIETAEQIATRVGQLVARQIS